MEKYDTTMMESAKIWAKNSSCKNLKVGAVIAKGGRIVSNGYNGTVSGTSNDCECEDECSECGGEGIVRDGMYADLCSKCKGIGHIKVTSPFTIHAEANAILWAAKNGLSTDGCTIFVTHSPCPECAKMIVQSGIKRVVYGEEYRDRRGLEFLEQTGVDVIKYLDQ